MSKPDFTKIIEENNKTHNINQTELDSLIQESNKVFKQYHTNDVWFERSIFINWTCGIADCKYCYLSTKPKKDMHALRSHDSILAEIILCKLMNWKVGYLTGGLRVESNDYLQELLKKCQLINQEKVRMNFGPYMKSEIDAFAPHTSGIGSAIESFNEDLHNFICPSKPLKLLKNMLDYCKEINVPTFITIILGMGEKKEDINEVIEKVKEYNIAMVQLCFLKPQENTVFSKVPPPDTKYMAWWIAKLRIAHPKIIIKVALVEERVQELDLLLDAGANCFSRFMVYKEFATSFTDNIISACKKSNRNLIGSFEIMPKITESEIINLIPDDSSINKEIVLKKVNQYLKRLRKGAP